MTDGQQPDLKQVNTVFDDSDPEEIIRWAHETFGNRMAVLSSFQKSGCALCHMISRMGLQKEVDVVFVDTGVNFRETYETIDRVRETYGLNIVSLHPKRTMAEQCREEGVLYITPEGQKRCCYMRKREPLFQIAGKYDALLASLRRADGGRRERVPIVVPDSDLKLLRVHPLANFMDQELEAYIQRHEVVTNPLHEQGYPTISCDRCTTPVLEGEPRRAGRWRHLEHANTYCEINPTDRADYTI